MMVITALIRIRAVCEDIADAMLRATMAFVAETDDDSVKNRQVTS